MKMELVENPEKKDPEKRDKKRFYTIKEAEKILNLSRAAIFRIRERKEISFYKFGDKVLFDMNQIEEYIKRSEVQNLAV